MKKMLFEFLGVPKVFFEPEVGLTEMEEAVIEAVTGILELALESSDIICFFPADIRGDDVNINVVVRITEVFGRPDQPAITYRRLARIAGEKTLSFLPRPAEVTCVVESFGSVRLIWSARQT